MSINLYNNAQIRKLQINGIDQTQNIRELYTGTSILTPYQMCNLSLVDASLIQDALYQSGIPIKIVYTAGDNSIVREYEFLSVARYKGNKINANRGGWIQIAGVTKSFFNLDNEHSSYHQNITASEALKKLHKEVDPSKDLNVTKTKGMIADIEPFHLRAIKLGRGVDIIRNRMTDDKYRSGAYTYFQDQNGDYWSKPLEQMFDEIDGPTFTHNVKGTSFINDQRYMAKNIFSLKKGSTNAYGPDNVANYDNARFQRGGKNDTGLDMSNYGYKSDSYEEQDLNRTGVPGKNQLSNDIVSNQFNPVSWDPNQKSQKDIEVDVANKNVMAMIALQGSLTFNVPLEGALECLVGKGCYIDMPAEVGDYQYKKSADGEKHLVIAQGEYLKFSKNEQMRAFASMLTASGGRQGVYA